MAEYDDDDVGAPAGAGEEKAVALREGRERKRRDRIAVAQLRTEISVMYADGAYLKTIAERFNISIPNVEYHINQLVDYWRSLGLKTIDEKKARELAYISRLERLATEAYMASMEGRRVTMKETSLESMRRNLRHKANKQEAQELKNADVRDDEVELTAEDVERARADEQAALWAEAERAPKHERSKEYERIEETPAGDPRWMSILLELSDRRCKLWGLYVKEHTPGDDETTKLDPETRRKRLGAAVAEAKRKVALIRGDNETAEQRQRSPNWPGAGGEVGQ